TTNITKIVTPSIRIFPYTTLFRSHGESRVRKVPERRAGALHAGPAAREGARDSGRAERNARVGPADLLPRAVDHLVRVASRGGPEQAGAAQRGRGGPGVLRDAADPVRGRASHRNR